MESPSLYSPEQGGGDGWCWTNLQNTHSGRKSRVCVNQPDRLTHPAKTFLLYLPFLSLPFCLSPCPSSGAGREVAFLKLAEADAEAMVGVGRICKIRIFLD